MVVATCMCALTVTVSGQLRYMVVVARGSLAAAVGG